jgi:hypothetical protein
MLQRLRKLFGGKQMDTSEIEQLRARNADLEKENAHLWETVLQQSPSPEASGPPVVQMFTGESCKTLSEEAPSLRPVSCPGCGAQNTVEGVCVHCGQPHEAWQ